MSEWFNREPPSTGDAPKSVRVARQNWCDPLPARDRVP